MCKGPVTRPHIISDLDAFLRVRVARGVFVVRGERERSVWVMLRRMAEEGDKAVVGREEGGISRAWVRFLKVRVVVGDVMELGSSDGDADDGICVSVVAVCISLSSCFSFSFSCSPSTLLPFSPPPPLFLNANFFPFPPGPPPSLPAFFTFSLTVLTASPYTR